MKVKVCSFVLLLVSCAGAMKAQAPSVQNAPVVAQAAAAEVKVPPMAAPAAPQAAAVAEAPVRRRINPAGKRDPFVSPVVARRAGASPACNSGKRCLLPEQVVLKGVVRSDNGMIAVVENAARRAYFLRENDPVFNGHVIRITADAIVFQQTVTNRVGKQTTREVVRRMSAPSV